MKKIIAFSLYGSNPKYTVGMIKNAKLSKKFYPDFEVFVFYDSTVPTGIIDVLNRYDHVKTINIEETKFASLPKMFWRFIPYEFTGTKNIIYIVRDSDSRLSAREAIAVKEWMDSDKDLHLMRDHPHHNHKILGGMWGIKYKSEFAFTKKIKEFLSSYKGTAEQRMTDMDWQAKYMYDMFLQSTMAHDEFFNYPNNKPFPVIRESNCEFVGEIFNEHDEPAPQREILKAELKNYQNQNPLVSVIIPSYNRFNMLLNAIGSVKNQTYKNIEVIVVDDCSTDSRYSNVLIGIFPGIKLLKTRENIKNPSYARNLGLQNAKGVFIAFLDDDDSFLPEKIFKQVRHMQSCQSMFCSTEAYYSNTEAVFNKEKQYKLYFTELNAAFIESKKGKSKLPPGIDEKFNTDHNYIITSSVMLHRDLVAKVGLFVYKGITKKYEDWDYWNRCMKYEPCLYMEIPLVFYNDSPREKFISFATR